MRDSCPHDPFRQARLDKGVLEADFSGETIPLILGYKELREAARDTKTFSSDTPCRVPIPAEEDVRTVRQLPLEVDPPEHTEYRKIVEPFFKRTTQPEYIEAINSLITDLLDQAIGQDSVEVVRNFALPLQSRALAVRQGLIDRGANPDRLQTVSYGHDLPSSADTSDRRVEFGIVRNGQNPVAAAR
jgi:cytochrome P450